MLFLMEYDRRQGKLVSFTTFSEESRQQANDARLELELSLYRKGIEREVVLLEAASEEALLRTHGRYFESLDERRDYPRVLSKLQLQELLGV